MAASKAWAKICICILQTCRKEKSGEMLVGDKQTPSKLHYPHDRLFSGWLQLYHTSCQIPEVKSTFATPVSIPEPRGIWTYIFAPGILQHLVPIIINNPLYTRVGPDNFWLVHWMVVRPVFCGPGRTILWMAL
jgi:hypothetical protein